MSHVVVAIALSANASSHQLLQQNIRSVSKVKDEIDGDATFFEHLCLHHCPWHTIQDEHIGVRVLNLASLPDHLNSCLIVNEVPFAKGLSEMINESLLIWAGISRLVLIDNFPKVVTH